MSEELLIESIRAYSLLYDPKERFYHDTIRKENAWGEVSTKTGISVSDCKRRWSLPRDAYRKALKNRQTKSGQANIPVKKWKFEDVMSFMVPIFAERHQKSNLAGEQSQNVYDEISIDTENIENLDPASTENSLLSPSSVSSTQLVSPISEPISPSIISPSIPSETLSKK